MSQMYNLLKIREMETRTSDNVRLCQVLPDRFLKLIDRVPDGCWKWLGSVRTRTYKHRRYRYGSYNGKLAHRLIYEALHGIIPSHLEIDHICHNKLCVNPAHLQVLTHQQNCARRPKSGPYPDPNSSRSRRGVYLGRYA
jgi:hypothetical protein